MDKEARKHINGAVLMALLGAFLSDKENLLFGLSTATLDGDKNKIGSILKERAKALGATDEEIERAQLAAAMTEDFFEEL